MMHYHVKMTWAHGLHLEKFFQGRFIQSVLIDIADVVMQEEQDMRNARLENPNLPVPTLMKLEVSLIQ